MISQPDMPHGLDVGVERIVAERVLGAGLGKERLACGIVAGQGPCALKRLGLAHQPYALTCLTQAGVVDLAGRLEPGEQRPFLGTADPQRHLAHKRGRVSGRVVGGTGTHRHQNSSPLDQEQMFLYPLYPQSPSPANPPRRGPSSPAPTSGAFSLLPS